MFRNTYYFKVLWYFNEHGKVSSESSVCSVLVINCKHSDTFKSGLIYVCLFWKYGQNMAKNDGWGSGYKQKTLQVRYLQGFVVVPPGIEPGTQGFSVLCSTNWAMAPIANQVPCIALLPPLINAFPLIAVQRYCFFRNWQNFFALFFLFLQKNVLFCRYTLFI